MIHFIMNHNLLFGLMLLEYHVGFVIESISVNDIQNESLLFYQKKLFSQT